MQNGQMRAKVAPAMSPDISCLLVSTAGIRNFLWQLLQVTIFCCVISKKCTTSKNIVLIQKKLLRGMD
jgi:hypothetical protein